MYQTNPRGVPRSGGIPRASASRIQTSRIQLDTSRTQSSRAVAPSGMLDPRITASRASTSRTGIPQQRSSMGSTRVGSSTSRGGPMGGGSMGGGPMGGGPMGGGSIRCSAMKGGVGKGGTKVVRSKEGSTGVARVVMDPGLDPQSLDQAPSYSRIEVKSTKTVKMPTLSTMVKKPREPILDKESYKKKMRRRLVPEGEDLKQIRKIINGLKGQDITVQEYVGLVSPYTGDNGEVLKKVMAEDVNAFRNMAKNIYETMTQDVSDVLTNEHVQLIVTQNEKYEIYTNKMMSAIDEIYDLCPDFDFEPYYAHAGEYLHEKFPLAKEVEIDPEEDEMLQRQEAYHRLQWLRSEGDRLTEENKRLQMRLNQLKKEQKEHLEYAHQTEVEVATQRAQLEYAEATLQDKLDDLNTAVDRSMIAEESAMMQRADVIHPKRRNVSKQHHRHPELRDGWNKKAAVDVENQIVSSVVEAEISKVSLKAKSSRPITIKKKKKKEAFHYSPIKTPPRADSRPRERSPFHFSPPKTPPEYYQQQAPRQPSPFHYSPPQQQRHAAPRQTTPSRRSPAGSPSSYYQPQQMQSSGKEPELQTTRVEKVTSVIEPGPGMAGPSRYQEPPGRRARGPRDSWGGFY